MEDNEHLTHKLMVLISLIQGFCLLYLHQAIELDYWPNNNPHWLFAFYSIALIWPVMLLLSLKSGNTSAIVKYTLPFALLVGCSVTMLAIRQHLLNMFVLIPCYLVMC